MATLNGAGRSYASSLVSGGKVDKSDAWSFSAADGDKWLGPNGDDWTNYGKHFMGIHGDQPEKTKGHYGYPFAKGETVYRAALTAISQRAGQQSDTEIGDAASALLKKIDPDGDKDRAQSGYHVRAMAGDSAEIMLYDVIGGGFLGGISAAQFASDLRNLGPIRTLDIRINSDGGDVFEGKAMYSLLAEHPANKTVYVDGLAASIASVIAMAGDTITMSDGAMMMLHNAWGYVQGNADEMEKQAVLLRSIDKTLCKTYADRTLMDPFKITDMMNAETWMTAQEALKNGFCTNIAGKTQMTAQVRDLVETKPNGRIIPPTERFKNLPSPLQPRLAAAKRSQAELQRLLDQIAA